MHSLDLRETRILILVQEGLHLSKQVPQLCSFVQMGNVLPSWSLTFSRAARPFPMISTSNHGSGFLSNAKLCNGSKYRHWVILSCRAPTTYFIIQTLDWDLSSSIIPSFSKLFCSCSHIPTISVHPFHSTNKLYKLLHHLSTTRPNFLLLRVRWFYFSQLSKKSDEVREEFPTP